MLVIHSITFDDDVIIIFMSKLLPFATRKLQKERNCSIDPLSAIMTTHTHSHTPKNEDCCTKHFKRNNDAA